MTHPNDQSVHKAINASAFKLGFSTVLHEFGVSSGKQNNPITPLCVS